jgi:hypothetical protein
MATALNVSVHDVAELVPPRSGVVLVGVSADARESFSQGARLRATELQVIRLSESVAIAQHDALAAQASLAAERALNKALRDLLIAQQKQIDQLTLELESNRLLSTVER